MPITVQKQTGPSPNRPITRTWSEPDIAFTFKGLKVNTMPAAENRISKSCQDICAGATCPQNRSDKAPNGPILYIGRFQPPHRGHLQVVSEMSKKADHLMIVIGSTNKERTKLNPLTFMERLTLMEMSIYDHKTQNPDAWGRQTRISYINMPDMQNDDDWNNALITKAQETDKTYTDSNKKGGLYGKRTLVIAGCEKDQSTAGYLQKLAKQTGLTLIKLPSIKDKGQVINAKDLRNILSDNKPNSRMSESDQEKLYSSITPRTLEWINNHWPHQI